jgi:hypothetical protein
MKQDVLELEDEIKINKEPKPGMEYLYGLDEIYRDWKPVKIKKYSVVTNLKKQEDERGYYFTLKETGEERYCNYGWAFIENTPENVKNLEAYNNQMKNINELQLKANELHKKVITLQETIK